MHIHVWDDGYQPDRYKLGFASRAAYKRLPARDPMTILPRVMPGASDPTGEYLIGDMERAGVDAAVAMVVDFSIASKDEQKTPIEDVIQNHAALTKKFPGKFFAFFGMDPRRPGAVERFEKAVKEEGFKGLKMYPACGFYPWDDICQPFYRKCVELNVPVLFHTATVGWPLTPRFAHPIHLGDVQREYPDMTIIFGHSGRPAWWRDAAAVAGGHWNSYLELAQWERVAEKDPGEFIRILGEMRDEVGAHRIVWASDYSAGPARSGEKSTWPWWVNFMKALPDRAPEFGVSFSKDEVDLILGGNAQRILGL